MSLWASRLCLDFFLRDKRWAAQPAALIILQSSNRYREKDGQEAQRYKNIYSCPPFFASSRISGGRRKEKLAFPKRSQEGLCPSSVVINKKESLPSWSWRKNPTSFFLEIILHECDEGILGSLRCWAAEVSCAIDNSCFYIILSVCFSHLKLYT